MYRCYLRGEIFHWGDDWAGGWDIFGLGKMSWMGYTVGLICLG